MWIPSAVGRLIVVVFFSLKPDLFMDLQKLASTQSQILQLFLRIIFKEKWSFSGTLGWGIQSMLLKEISRARGGKDVALAPSRKGI